MLEELKHDIKHKYIPRINGIVTDTQALMHQEIALVKSEAKQELKQAKTAVCMTLIGGSVSLVGLSLFCFGLTELLISKFPTIAPWQHYAAVGASLLAIGAGLMYFLVPTANNANTPTFKSHREKFNA